VSRSKGAAGVVVLFGIAMVLAASGCGGRRQPVIPRAASVQRHTYRDAIEGRDTTLVRLSYPEFVGARTPEALDSLRATVRRLLVAPIEDRGVPAASPATFMDGFISRWNAHRKATRSRAFWRLDRNVEVLAETLGVVSLARTDFFDFGGAHPMMTVRLVNVDADDGRTLRFADLFEDATRDSLSAALEPTLRADYGVAADSSLTAAGFAFADDRFHVNDNVAVTTDGMRWHFDPYEIAPYATGPIDLIAPFDQVRPFARADGPLGRRR